MKTLDLIIDGLKFMKLKFIVINNNTIYFKNEKDLKKALNAFYVLNQYYSVNGLTVNF